MACRIQITLPAKRDAQEYAPFIGVERQSPEAARRWLDGLYRAIRELDELPYRFSVIPEAGELGVPYRSFVYHSRRVVDAVHEDEKRVWVHRVYHGARSPRSDGDIE